APTASLHLNNLNKFLENRSGLYRCTTIWSIGGGYVAQVPVSAFLVRHDTIPHDWALIDTCAPDEYSIFVNAIDEDLVHAQDSTRYICITHAHYDYSGGIHALLDKYPESKVVVPVEEKPFVCDGHQFKKILLFKLSIDYLHEVKVRVPADRTVALLDRDHWEFGHVLEFVETPGHTLDSASFIHVPSRSIMVGDTAKNYSNVSGLMPASTCHWGNAMKAVDKILSLDDRVDTVFPAHDVGQKLTTK
ncbi:hypothetical protein CPB97_001546, partial [Podila verticillata]